MPLIGRNNMKKKLLLAPLMAVLVACVVVLSGCGGPSIEELITEDLTTQFDEVKNGGDDFNYTHCFVASVDLACA